MVRKLMCHSYLTFCTYQIQIVLHKPNIGSVFHGSGIKRHNTVSHPVPPVSSPHAFLNMKCVMQMDKKIFECSSIACISG